MDGWNMEHCLPDHARRHFINLRGLRLERDLRDYQARLRDFRSEWAAKSAVRLGWQDAKEWKMSEEYLDALASGYVQDAIDTCNLYDIPLTSQICQCLEQSAAGYLVGQYGNKLRMHGATPASVKVPLSMRQSLAGQIQNRNFPILSEIQIMLEKARVASQKGRTTVTSEKSHPTSIFVQNIHQEGGYMNASQNGDVQIQQLTVSDLELFAASFSDMRALLKQQEPSVEIDESVGLLAGAQRAAASKDEGKMMGYLKQIPTKSWELVKATAPQVLSQSLLHFLKEHNLA